MLQMSRYVIASVYARLKSSEHVFATVKIWSNSKKYASLVPHIYCRIIVIEARAVLEAT